MPDSIVVNNIRLREVAGRTGTRVRGPSDTAKRRFMATGTNGVTVGFDAAIAALLDAAQTLYVIEPYDGLSLKTISYDEFAPNSLWLDLDYDYTPPVGGYTVSIDTTGGLVRATEAFSQTAYPAVGEAAPDFGTAINVQDGKPEGVDIVIPALKIDIRATMAKSLFAGATGAIAYAKTLAGMTGRTNSVPFLTFAVGELLYAGSSGDIISDQDNVLTHTFIASQNDPSLAIGPISGIVKSGHQYAWVQYKAEKDSMTDLQKQVPRVAFVATTYLTSTFADIGIGIT